MLVRNAANPLIRPQNVQASRSDFEVIGTFNAGAVLYGDEIMLLVRVAERPLPTSDSQILCPYLSGNGDILISAIDRADPNYDTSDPRKIEHRQTGELLLTSISHLRLARSSDGVHFTVDTMPWLTPFTADEGFGIEDGRITCIDDVYYINYTAVSRYGVATAMATTRDFVTVERQGIIFPPANRDVAIFPERINGQYVCYHRPMPGMFGGYHIWMATSPDLYHWGQHRRVLEAKPDGWESGRVGGGAPPVKTEAGWLSIYHAADRQDRYCLGAFLTPHDQPQRIIAYSRTPILSPEAAYETSGFFPNVVFTCGVVVQGDHLRVYYGASDECVALAETSITDLMRQLEPVNERPVT
jgi:beta-1,2-mannobiose phosphorylase / 1,2-beta-oligomannan phosphorylase